MYVVVFKGTGGEKGNYPGVVTWTAFKNEEDFNRFLLESECTEEIIAHGITKEEAIEIVRRAPILPNIGLAFQEASQGDEFDYETLENRLATIAFAARERGIDLKSELPRGFPLLK